MRNTQKAYLQLHIAVLLFGLTAILGDLISLSALVLVWWRVLLATVSLFFLIDLGKKLRPIPRKMILRFMGIGILVALHWIAFFGSIKYANASICLITFATTSLFTAFFEPFILNKQIKWYEVSLAVLIIPGMVLIVNNIDFSMWFGFFLGIFAAALASLFAILNKKLVNEADSFSITFLELGSSWLFISLLFPFYFFYTNEAPFWPTWSDWVYLLVLSLLCTTLAYVLALNALKHLSAFAANLIVNLEPIYGILLAVLILHENKELNAEFYLGGGLIILTVFLYPLMRKKFDKNTVEEADYS